MWLNAGMEVERISTRTLRKCVEGQSIARILHAALTSVDPYATTRQNLVHDGGQLTVANTTYDLESIDNIFVIGAGKAGFPMARAVLDVLSDQVTEGLVIVKDGHVGDADLTPIVVREARHPLPDDRGVSATRELVELLRQVSAHDLVICLISGGGSALLTSPVEGVTLNDVQKLTDLLLHCGAEINEINSLRKHLDVVKGGGLAKLIAPTKLVTLFLSDVIGDRLDVIASGPTVPDSSTFQQSWDVISRYQLEDAIPISIRSHIENGVKGVIEDTPKEADPIFDNTVNQIIGNIKLAADAAVQQAIVEGFNATLLTTRLGGEAYLAGQYLGTIAKGILERGEPIEPPACVVAGGETTVVVRGEGTGGRNQELALGAVESIAGLPRVVLVTMATDGGDGPTDAAGAVVDGETLLWATNIGLNPAEYLKKNDSYTFFSQLDDLLITGPTQTNVNDLAFLFVFE